MQIKMREWYQGTGQPTLKPDTEHDSAEIGLQLCEWLIDHRKAVDVTPEPEPVEIIAELPTDEPETAPVKNTPKKAAPRARKPRARAKK